MGWYPQGERHGRAKLTEDDVRAIRRAAAQPHGTRGAAELARAYGVRKYTVQLILLGKTWKHVSDHEAAQGLRGVNSLPEAA